MMEKTAQKNPVSIYVESNPNPNSLKFVANFMLLNEGEYHDFPNEASASNSELAQELFTYPFVRGVFIMSNFVTVTKDDETDWEEVKMGIREHIKDYIESGKSVVNADAQPTSAPTEIEQNDSDIVVKIKSILEEYIRPAVESDGGAISFDSYNEGLVKVILQGSCSGCPSSTITLKAGIENLLKRMLPEVTEVEAING